MRSNQQKRGRNWLPIAGKPRNRAQVRGHSKVRDGQDGSHREGKIDRIGRKLAGGWVGNHLTVVTRSRFEEVPKTPGTGKTFLDPRNSSRQSG